MQTTGEAEGRRRENVSTTKNESQIHTLHTRAESLQILIMKLKCKRQRIHIKIGIETITAIAAAAVAAALNIDRCLEDGSVFFLAYNRLYARKHVKRKCAQKHTCTHTEYLQRKSAIDREEKKEILRQKKLMHLAFVFQKCIY